MKADNIDVVNDVRDPLALVAWTTAAIVLVFLCLTHLGVQLVLLTDRLLLPGVVPASFIASVVMGDWLGRREGLNGRRRILSPVLACVLTLSAVVISSVFYDLSWDGQWYQQPAIYHLSEEWNPLTHPMEQFGGDISLWLRHYAKGGWYAGAAMVSTTGIFESSKYVTWLAFDCAMLTIFAACLDVGMSRRKAVVIAVLTVLNPVVTTELFSYMVDGIMICYLGCVVASLFSGFRRGSGLVITVGVTATVCCINSKLTGLAFLCFILAAAGLYALICRRDLVLRFTGVSAAAVLVGVLLFGYNPYVTNTVHRGNPFYPYKGSAAYPSLEEQGNEGIIKYETPKNLLRHNRVVRHGFALFGQPGMQPYNGGPDALLMWPFCVPLKELAVYHAHEVRVAGFGPLFSGALIISWLLSIWLLFQAGMPRFVMLLGGMTLVLSLLISPHTWWARYGPQMYWVPIIPVIAVFYRSRYRFQSTMAWVLTGILLINGLTVTAIHLNWEIASTRTLNRQLTALRDSGAEIEVELKWFAEAVGRRFQDWGIPYRPVGRNAVGDGEKLMSVVDGYPGVVEYRVVRDCNSDRISMEDDLEAVKL